MPAALIFADFSGLQVAVWESGFYADNIFMTLKDACDEFLLYIGSVRGLSQNTVEGYGRDLEKFQSFLAPSLEIGSVTQENILLCIGMLSAQRASSASVNRFMSAVRNLFAYAKKIGYIDRNPAQEVRNVKNPQVVAAFMTEREVDALCSQPSKKELLWTTRDTAIFRMLYSSGCRISELTNIRLSDFRRNYHSAVITGKGNKQRIVYFDPVSRNALASYLADRKKVLVENGRDAAEDRLFINQKGLPITTGGMRYILSRYSGEEGTKKHVNPHAFRHTFATTLLNNGADVRMVQELLGHSSINTTQRYTHITTERLKEVYNLSHPHSH